MRSVTILAQKGGGLPFLEHSRLLRVLEPRKEAEGGEEKDHRERRVEVSVLIKCEPDNVKTLRVAADHVHRWVPEIRCTAPGAAEK